MEQILERLEKWCKENFINLERKDEYTFHCPDFGDLLLILPKHNKILKKGLLLNYSKEDFERYEFNRDINFLFEFGERWYYCQPKEMNDEINENKNLAGYVIERQTENKIQKIPLESLGFNIEFNDLKFIGNPQIDLNIPFIHLGVHSEYELLNGSGKASLWCKKAKFLQHTSIGICDKNTLAGALSFQTSCDKNQLQPIIGETITVAIDYDEEKEYQITYDVKLYVKNNIGWDNLVKISNDVNTKYKDFIPEQELFERSEGLILVFPKESILIENLDSPKEFIKTLNKYKTHFPDNYFQIDTVEYYDDKHDVNNLKNIKTYLEKYKKLIPPILINDSYYVDKEMFPLKEYLNKISNKAMKYSENEYFKNIDEVHEEFGKLFKEEDEWITFLMEMVGNTVKLAGQCNFKIEVGKPKLPKYEFTDGKTSDEKFYELIEKGVQEILIERDGIKGKELERYRERIQTECKVIIPAMLSDYFLILEDIIGWCTNNCIMIGTGRGSAAGSIISYIFSITAIDPIKYNLLFERFLNETRVSPIIKLDIEFKNGEKKTIEKSDYKEEDYNKKSILNIVERKELRGSAMPDVDFDTPSGYRDIVKEYIKERFGYDYTCSVGTYGKFQLKAALKDFGKVKGLDFNQMNFITKEIDNQIEYEWKDLIGYALESPELYKFCQKNFDIVHLVKFALQQPKSRSVHASAVIIVPKEDKTILDMVPLRMIDGNLVSEWEGGYMDKAGYLKEDVLGLSQLDKFMSIIELIKKNKGEDIKVEDIPMDDEATYKMFTKGNNEDVFQFNGTGIKRYSQKVKPDNIEDLIAMNALWRPGAMGTGAHEKFALIKNGKIKAKYDFGLEEVTKPTQGLLIYQEQIMQAFVAAGLTLVDADTARNVIKKHDHKLLETFEERFIGGMISKGCDKYEAIKIWKNILSFSAYSFNRSHAAAYAVISYRSQYFKVNYPLEFWTTSFQFAKKETDITKRISEMKKIKQGVYLKPPFVNVSTDQFECDPKTNSIYWSLAKIKGIGESRVKYIIEERDKNGLFDSYNNFIERVPKKLINKGSLTALILSGAFDEIEEIENPRDRLQLLSRHFTKNGETLPDEYKSHEARKDYFWIFEQKKLTGYGEVQYENLLRNKKELLRKYVDSALFFKKEDYEEVCICGVLIFYNEKLTKNGKYFCNIEIMCNNDILFIRMWEEAYLRYKDEMDNYKNKVIAITGKVRFDDWKGTNVLNSTDDTEIHLI